MNRPLFASFVLALLAAAPAQDEKFTRLALRALATRPTGDVVVDRGGRDLLMAGDKVVLLPRNGTILHGAVHAVQDRDAVVRLVDRNAVVTPGTKGEVLVPRNRRQPRNAGVPGSPCLISC